MNIAVELTDHPETAKVERVCPKCGGTNLESTFVAWSSGAAGFQCNDCNDGEEFVIRFESPMN